MSMMPRIRGSNYHWWAFGALAIGMFASVADHGSVIVALPSIAEHFDTDLPTTQWVVIGYALTISALLLPMGRLSDIIGRKEVYIAGMVAFIIGGAIAGAATDITVLILAKVLQGAGSAMTQGTAMAMILSAFPQAQRGKALGLQMSMVGLGGVAGPSLGGFIVGAFGWRWVFYSSILMAVVAVIAALILLDSARSRSDSAQRGAFDWFGAALSTGAMVVFLLGMTSGPRLGWGSPLITGSVLLVATLLATFIWWELKCSSPMLDVRLFKRRLFTFGISASFVSFLGMSSVRFLMPFYLQKVLGYSPSQVGLIIVPSAISMIVFGPLSGRLSDRFGTMPFNVGGLAVSIAGLFLLSTLQVGSPLYHVMIGMVLQSSGMALFNAPNNSSVLSVVEDSKLGVVSAFLNLARNSANVTSIALATAIVTATMASEGFPATLDEVSGASGPAFTSGLQIAFRVAGSFVIVAMFLSSIRGKQVVTAKPEPSEQPVAQTRS